jgi:putative redox protein
LHPPAVLYLWRHSNRAVAGLCNFKGAIASNTLRYLRQKPYHMKIVTKMLGDEVYEAVTKDGIPVIIDMRPLPEKQNQSPVELLLSSLSACGAVDIVSMLKKRKKTIDSFIIETEGIRRDETPRSFTAIHCQYIIASADVTEEEFHKAAKLSLEKYCSVAASLNAAITFSVSIIKPV